MHFRSYKNSEEIMNQYIIMDLDRDNCATAIKEIKEGEQINLNQVTLRLNESIKRGHKFAIKDIQKGNYVRKYGKIIGITTEKIKQGDWIHTHNLKSKYLEEVNNE
jgi:hypothetical protein